MSHLAEHPIQSGRSHDRRSQRKPSKVPRREPSGRADGTFRDPKLPDKVG
jgi:hypothetical protein